MDSYISQTIDESKVIQFENYRCTSLLLITNFLIIGTREGYLFVYDTISETKSSPFNISRSTIESMCEYKDLSFFASRASEILLMLLDPQSLSLAVKRTFSGHTDVITAVSYSKNTLYSASEDHLVFSWDLEQSTHDLLYSHESPILSFDIHSKTGQIATCCNNNILKVFSLSKKVSKSLELKNNVFALRFINKGNFIVLGNSDGSILYLESLEMKLVNVIQPHDTRIKYLALLNDSGCLASCSFDQNIIVINDMVEIAILLGHKDWVRALEFDKNKQLLFSCGDDSTLRIWNIKGVIKRTQGVPETYNKLREKVENYTNHYNKLDDDRCCSGCFLF